MAASLREEIRVYPDAASLAQAAAVLVNETAGEAIAAQGTFAAALSGGETPRLLFRLLGSEYGENMRGKQVHLFWADERAVPPDHEQSNFHMANVEMIAKLAIPPERIHRIRGELPPAKAAEVYEKDLRDYFGKAGMPGIDLMLLGVGADGHTASLFPGSDALGEKRRMALPVPSPDRSNWRITLTLPVLNNASLVMFLVSGRSKAGVIGTILGQGKRDAYPAGMVRPVKGSVIWLLDQEAASRL